VLLAVLALFMAPMVVEYFRPSPAEPVSPPARPALTDLAGSQTSPNASRRVIAQTTRPTR
jgi:hypothetical protein